MSSQDLDQALADSLQQMEKTINILAEYGFSYDFDPLQWLTIKHYAEQYGHSIETVINWIAEGVIPNDCVLDVPELNHIRLIKNQPYQ